MPKTAEQNLIVRIGESEAEVTSLIIKDCARGIVLLKLTTDTKHRAAFLRQQRYSYLGPMKFYNIWRTHSRVYQLQHCNTLA